jgi:hypothetical protein
VNVVAITLRFLFALSDRLSTVEKSYRFYSYRSILMEIVIVFYNYRSGIIGTLSLFIVIALRA